MQPQRPQKIIAANGVVLLSTALSKYDLGAIY
jgi:hypothetical protein